MHRPADAAVDVASRARPLRLTSHSCAAPYSRSQPAIIRPSMPSPPVTSHEPSTCANMLSSAAHTHPVSCAPASPAAPNTPPSTSHQARPRLSQRQRNTTSRASNRMQSNITQGLPFPILRSVLHQRVILQQPICGISHVCEVALIGTSYHLRCCRLHIAKGVSPCTARGSAPYLRHLLHVRLALLLSLRFALHAPTRTLCSESTAS
mmetsp:Transcript_8231/g.21836  ORF Transcript_8231/g.21836 Transcript_8231/m.21836 type:complete len:207 (-) Transcript_8231:1047-1667(-)